MSHIYKGRALIMKKIINTLLAFILIFAASTAYAEDNTKLEPLFPVALNHTFPDSKDTFEEVKKLILENYYSDEISEDALYWAAIEGMLRRISPPENKELAKIWTPEEYTKILDSLKGEQVSIGIKTSFNAGDGSLTVNEILPVRLLRMSSCRMTGYSKSAPIFSRARL